MIDTSQRGMVIVGSYLTTAEVAQRYRTAQATVRYWRHIGYGPKGVKVGRRVLYAESEVCRFDKQLTEQVAT
ncbi:helix-turn-helix transcriptional regulator [Streptomyces sp. DT203]|uniref:helix-turn-helix transcriptional regulator n=1 Tax=Streptomyces sp. DT203 TaxID=3393424 RepID=UPI003CF140E5